jgi:hypothetical protein
MFPYEIVERVSYAHPTKAHKSSKMKVTRHIEPNAPTQPILFEKREEGNRNKGLGIGKAGLIVLTSCMISLILISLVVTLITSEASAANLSTARARQMAKQQQQQQQRRPAVETTNPYVQQKNSTRPRYIPRGHKHYRLDLSKTMTHQQHIRIHTPAYKPRVKPYILPSNLELKLL